jgi:thioredoxin-dependent peroxiredoxin
MMKRVQTGDAVPDFQLPDQDGVVFDISSVLGKKNLVIYFYPKDNTPGCTREACYFRDQYDFFRDADAEVIGISGQPPESHKVFAEKYNLHFKLLSDEGNRVRKLFGVPSQLFGLIPGRVTYVVDKASKVVFIFNSQKQIARHVDETLRILKEMKS